ncbi:IclR family transcriptional regulator [Halorussus salinisoli]|uniref:IclR family transcriptional regulator n=1 Tax=Halorussus salinisoli TaxID=2558242 RepID=UPI0010C1D159|nr:IclR family transcriptional regulator [Halorussus salinisoli]
MTKPTGPRPIKSVETTFVVIEAIRDLDGARLTEIANHLNMAKSTVHRYLSTLEQLEYLTKRGDIYYVSHRFLDLGEYTRTRKKEYELIEGSVEELAEKTEERVQFIVEEHGMGVYLYRESGEHAVQTDSRPGKRIHMHSTAAGKAILTFLPESRVTEIVERRGLPKMTENTITTQDSLFDELQETRERGYSIAKEENTERLWAFGVPVMSASDRVLGAISISGPTHRLAGDEKQQEIPDLLRGTVNELELNIAYL